MTRPLVGGVFGRLLFSGPSLALTLRMGTAAPGCRLDPAGYLGDGDQQGAIGTIFGAALQNLRAWYAPIEASLAAVAVPTVVVWGDRDPFFTPAQGRRTAAAIPGARFILLDRTGHSCPANAPSNWPAPSGICSATPNLPRAARTGSRTGPAPREPMWLLFSRR